MRKHNETFSHHHHHHPCRHRELHYVSFIYDAECVCALRKWAHVFTHNASKRSSRKQIKIIIMIIIIIVIRRWVDRKVWRKISKNWDLHTDALASFPYLNWCCCQCATIWLLTFFEKSQPSISKKNDLDLPNVKAQKIANRLLYTMHQY